MPSYRSDYMPVLMIMGTYSHILNHTWLFLLRSLGAGYQSTLENVFLSHECGVHVEQHQENNCGALLETRLPWYLMQVLKRQTYLQRAILSTLL